MFVSACGGSSMSGTPEDLWSGVSDKPDPAKPKAKTDLPFETCSLVTGGTDTSAECVTVSVPLDWAQPENSKVDFFVKRVIGSGVGDHRQLWLLQGGPGVAGDAFESLAAELSASDPLLDIYLPDHRGTGRSSKLDCSLARSTINFDYAGCLKEMKIKWGFDGLGAFNTTNAARDVGYVIEHTVSEDTQVHVYGVSYGTYWAQRYLQLFPTQPTAVVLDGLCQSGLCSYLKAGYWTDRVGKKYLAECGADAMCSGMLGSDPTAKVKQAIAKAGQHGCAGFTAIDGAALRRVFSWFLTSFELRALIPATTYRVIRCNADDVTALKQFELTMTTDASIGTTDIKGMQTAQSLASDMLGRNIAFSELEPSPAPTKQELANLLDGAVFTTQDASLRDEYDSWPKYAHDPWVGNYPSSSAPILMMNGTLDPQTPEEFADIVAPHYPRAFQGLVVFPRAAHGVIEQSPVSSQLPSTSPAKPTCGMNLWSQFLKSPTRTLDTSCTGQIQAHDFAGNPELAQHFFGTESMWGTEPASASGKTGTTSGGAAPSSARLSSAVRKAIQASHPLLQGALLAKSGAAP